MPPTMTPHALTSAQKAMIWDALTMRIVDPAMAHEKDQTRALRDLLTDADVTVFPRQS